MKKFSIILFILLSTFLIVGNATGSEISNMRKYIEQKYHRDDSLEIARNIWIKSNEIDIDHVLVLAIIEQESSFRENVVSKKHARGLMQVRWSVWKDHLRTYSFVSYKQLHQIDMGVEAGIIVLKYYMEKYSLEEALYRYSGGYISYTDDVKEKMDAYKEFAKKQSPWYAE